MFRKNRTGRIMKRFWSRLRTGRLFCMRNIRMDRLTEMNLSPRERN